jgi:hypothetical protein
VREGGGYVLDGDAADEEVTSETNREVAASSSAGRRLCEVLSLSDLSVEVGHGEAGTWLIWG